MSGEEDEKEYELKDLIVQTLEANGVLPKIKAQIRANVFMALDETDKKNPNSNSNIPNVAANKVMETNEGRIAAALVRDFLEMTNLEYTLAVYDPELNSGAALDRREKLVDMFKSSSIRDLPVLVDVIKQANSPSDRNAAKTETISQQLTDAIKARFDHIDSNRKGFIDEEKAKALFGELFPHFSQAIIDAYLNEEFDNSDTLKGVEYLKFLSLFKKFYFKCQQTFNSTKQEITSYSHKTKASPQADTRNDPLEKLGLFKNEQNLSKGDLKKTSNFGNGLSSLEDLPPLNGANQSKKSINSLNKDLEKGFKDANDDNYDDDFTSGTTPRTPRQDKNRVTKTRGGFISDEDIEENISYVDESSKIDEVTQDKSISTIQNNDADYIEDLSI